MSQQQGDKARALGFGQEGVKAGTTAAEMMRVNQGNIPEGGVVAENQRAGAKFGSGPTGGDVGESLGFTSGGIEKNSTAAHMMSVNKGNVPRGGVVAEEQRAGAKGGKN